jgi:hypothetical protein
MGRMRERAGQPGLPTRSSLGNFETALRHFAEERSRPLGEPIGGLLRLGYPKALEGHTKFLKARKADKRLIANRRSALKTWCKLLASLDREYSAETGSKSPFAAAVSKLVECCIAPDGKRVPVKTIALQSGVPLATLRRWIGGARPKGRNVPSHIKRLEHFFGVVPGALWTVLTGDVMPGGTSTAAPGNEYRARLSQLSRDPYYLKPAQTTAELRNEWGEFVEYKTQLFSRSIFADGADAGARKLWRLHPPGSRCVGEHNWIDFRNGRFCPSARRCFEFVAAYLGWLSRSPDVGGAGMDQYACQTLGFLTDVDLLTRYLEWRIDRSGGVICGSVDATLKFAAMITHPKTGFLRRSRQFGPKVGVESADEWSARCDRVYTWSRATQKKIAEKLRMSRDPFEPIKAIVALRHPLSAVADAIQRMRASPVDTGGRSEAIWHRDILLVALLASNPIRARNLKELTWRADNTGDLRQDSDGAWRIVIARHRLKNSTGAARDADYSCKVQKPVWTYIERYLREYRSLLGGASSDLVFVCPSGRPGPWEGLNRRFFWITRRYFVGTPGFGTHAMRHIVATAIIKKSGSIVRAAKALHDRPETVEKHYGFLMNDDVAAWMADELGDAYDRF